MGGLRHLGINAALSSQKNRSDSRKALLSQPEHPIPEPGEPQQSHKDLKIKGESPACQAIVEETLIPWEVLLYGDGRLGEE